MSHAAANDLVLEFSRDLVMEVAPEELVLFTVTSQAFLQDPKRMLARHEARDNPVGFGMADAVPLLTPVVLTVVSAVINFLIAEVTKATSTESASLIQSTVRRVFKRFHAAEEKTEGKEDKKVPALTRQQLTQVRMIVLREVRRTPLSGEDAKRIADAIIGRLAISVGGSP